MSQIFETVSFHIVKPCNMKCKFCYATFNDFSIKKQITLMEMTTILFKLKEAGVKKVTFAGGEPMLHKDLSLAIMYAKSIGLVTSIITNGILITKEWLFEMKNHLDWIGLSIDSLNIETNIKIGRISKKTNIGIGRISKGITTDYYKLITAINMANFKLKINTVVNIHNQEESMKDFIEWTGTTRWKIFDTLKVEGQNDEQYNSIKPTIIGFERFLQRNEHSSMVVETNNLMTSSYLLIDPLGRMFENTQSKHTYSDSLITHSVEHCLSQISLDRSKFIERGGIYKW